MSPSIPVSPTVYYSEVSLQSKGLMNQVGVYTTATCTCSRLDVRLDEIDNHPRSLVPVNPSATRARPTSMTLGLAD